MATGIGNVILDLPEECPACGALVIERGEKSFSDAERKAGGRSQKCPNCGAGLIVPTDPTMRVFEPPVVGMTPTEIFHSVDIFDQAGEPSWQSEERSAFLAG